MKPKSDKSNPTESHLHTVPTTLGSPEPWWRGIGYNPIPQVEQGNDSQPSSLRCSNGGSDSSGSRSQSDEEESEEGEEEEDSPIGSRNAASPQSRQAHGKEAQNSQPDSSVPTMHDDQATQHAPQLELDGHSIACASNPYQDPYYGGMMAAYGHPSMAYPFVGIPHARMALPLDLAQEPVYVNAKQFQGIMRRRQARAKAELEKKLIKVRKPYLHESRHQHAMRRERGSGGRFTKKTDTNAPNAPARDKKGATSGPTLSLQSASSSGSERLPTDSTDIWNTSGGQQALKTRNYRNGNSQGGFKPSSACNPRSSSGDGLGFHQQPRERLH